MPGLPRCTPPVAPALVRSDFRNFVGALDHENIRPSERHADATQSQRTALTVDHLRPHSARQWQLEHALANATAIRRAANERLHASPDPPRNIGRSVAFSI